MKFLFMWSDFKFLVMKSEISPHMVCVLCGECLHTCKIHAFCCKFGFVAIYALWRKICLLQFTRFCVEKNLTKKLPMWRKIDKHEV